MTRQNPNSVPDSQLLQVVLRPSQRQVGRWSTVHWEFELVDGPGATEPPPGGWSGRIALVLHRDEVDDYRLNLASETPRLFLICSRGETDDHLIPRKLGISAGEAAAHLETDDEVLSCPLPTGLRDWIAAYTVLVPINPEVQRRKGSKRRRV